MYTDGNTLIVLDHDTSYGGDTNYNNLLKVVTYEKP